MADDDNYTLPDDEPDFEATGGSRDELQRGDDGRTDWEPRGGVSALGVDFPRSSRLLRAGVLGALGVALVLLAGWSATSTVIDEGFGKKQAFFGSLTMPLNIAGALLIVAAVLIVVVGGSDGVRRTEPESPDVGS